MPTPTDLLQGTLDLLILDPAGLGRPARLHALTA